MEVIMEKHKEIIDELMEYIESNIPSVTYGDGTVYYRKKELWELLERIRVFIHNNGV